MPGARLAAAAFVVLVTVPGLLYLAGIRPPTIDNRDHTALPDPADVLALDQDALDQLTDHLADTIPGRDLAVALDARTQLAMGRSPNPDVVIGQDGWLFFRPTLEVDCGDAERVAEVRRQMTRAEALVSSTGRRWAVAVAPDKASVYPGQLPDDHLTTWPCRATVEEAILRDLERDPPPGYLPTWDEIRGLAEAADPAAPIYWPLDTHWTTAGAWPFSRALVESLRPGMPHEVVVTDEETKVADLTKLMGIPTAGVTAGTAVARDGIQPSVRGARVLDHAPPDLPTVYGVVTRADGEPVIDGRSVLWHDSFGDLATAQLAPFFEELVMVRDRPMAADWVATSIGRADTVLYQTAQRALVSRWTEGNVVAQLAWAFRDDLPSAEVVPGAEGWAPVIQGGVGLGEVDVAVAPADGIAEGERGEPARLEVRSTDGRVTTLAPQRDLDHDVPRVYDLDGVTDAAAVRLVTRAGLPVEIDRFVLIASGV